MTSRRSLLIAGTGALATTVAGYRGGWVDTAIMRVGEVLGGIPTLILILAITAAFRVRITDGAFWLADNTFLNTQDARMVVQFALLVGASVPFAWIGGCRVVRSQALSLREMQFVLAAESQGASTWRVITRHVLPSVMPLFLVGVTGGRLAKKCIVDPIGWTIFMAGRGGKVVSGFVIIRSWIFVACTKQ